MSSARAEAANAVVQRYAGQERAPLLIFTLPDSSGVQFIYGVPIPGNIRRRHSVHRLTYRWGEHNRTTPDALEQIGQAIAGGQPPQIALQDGFNVQPVTEAFFRDYKAAYDATAAELAAQMMPDDAAAYTQTPFNRLLFVHFVSRKGWLVGKGSRDYLNALWQDYRDNPAPAGFYASRRDALFHDGMNTPPGQRRQGIDQIISSARRPTATAGCSSATRWISRALSSATTS